MSHGGMKNTVINTVDLYGMWRYLMGRLGIKGKAKSLELQGL